jgi:hypothetical protein
LFVKDCICLIKLADHAVHAELYCAVDLAESPP